MKRVVIIGNGISGITAARHIRKLSNYEITVISAETDHFYSRTALMYIYMGHMRFENTKPYEDWFWKKNNIHLLNDFVTGVATEQKVLQLKSGKSLAYDILIIGSGSSPNMYGWPGQQLKGVQGLYSFQDLQLMEHSTKGIQSAVVVGGGLIGVEMAEMLLSRNIHVTFLVREKSFWANVLPLKESQLITRHIQSHHVRLLLDTELKEICGDAHGRVNSIITSKGETIPCEFAGITVGVSPNISFLKNSGIETKRGVLVNKFLKTNIEDVYAVGDCVERTYELQGRRPVEQVWYTGRMMGEVVAQTICGNPTAYEPGPWFNSAKFFDIEYQTYGHVSNVLKENEEDFYWEHTDGNKCVHLVWDKKTRVFIGINTFGIRMRHEKFDTWLRSGKSIDFVVSHLAEANFDPEFFEKYESEIANSFAHQYNNKSQAVSN